MEKLPKTLIERVDVEFSTLIFLQKQQKFPIAQRYLQKLYDIFFYIHCEMSTEFWLLKLSMFYETKIRENSFWLHFLKRHNDDTRTKNIFTYFSVCWWKIIKLGNTRNLIINSFIYATQCHGMKERFCCTIERHEQFISIYRYE